MAALKERLGDNVYKTPFLGRLCVRTLDGWVLTGIVSSVDVCSCDSPKKMILTKALQIKHNSNSSNLKVILCWISPKLTALLLFGLVGLKKRNTRTRKTIQTKSLPLGNICCNWSQWVAVRTKRRIISHFSFTVFLLYTNNYIVPRLYKQINMFTYTPTNAYMKNPCFKNMYA